MTYAIPLKVLTLIFLPLVTGATMVFRLLTWVVNTNIFLSKSIDKIFNDFFLNNIFFFIFNYREVTQKEVYAEGPSENKLKNEQPEKTYVEKYLDFVPLRQALAVKSGKAGIGITKRTSPVLILVHILFKFHQLKDRYPDSQYGDEDIELLNRLKEEVADDLAYSKSSLKILEDDKFHHHVYGELSPVSAIIGGALGQDMIRSITHQDAPIRNFFLFNGLRLSGTVESIGK